MITHVAIDRLPVELRHQVLAAYREACKQPHHRLTYREAAWLYGYSYQTIRWLVGEKRLRTVGRGAQRLITHAAMRQYITTKGHGGRPRAAQKLAQTTLA